MPYRNKRRSRARRGYHPYLLASSPAVGYVAMKAARMVARKYLNPELKSHDVANQDTITDGAGKILNLSNIVQGLDSVNRIGRSIKVKEFSFNAVLTQNSSATNTQVRIIIIADQQQEGSNDPSWLEVCVAVAPTSLLNVTSTRKRFKILYDRLFTLSIANVTMIPFRFKKKMSHVIQYTGTTAADASNGKGSLYLMAISNEVTNDPTLDISTRILYLDN